MRFGCTGIEEILMLDLIISGKSKPIIISELFLFGLALSL